MAENSEEGDRWSRRLGLSEGSRAAIWIDIGKGKR